MEKIGVFGNFGKSIESDIMTTHSYPDRYLQTFLFHIPLFAGTFVSTSREDAILLNVWSGPTVQSAGQGYRTIANDRQISKRLATRLVHQALERRGFDPHSSPKLIAIWLRLHRAAIHKGETE